MKTTIKSIILEKYNNELTGRLVVNITDAIDAFAREVDEDGVESFVKTESTTIRIRRDVFVAQVRAAAHNIKNPAFGNAFGYRLDSAKVGGVEELFSVLNVLLQGASIEIESELKEANDEEQTHDAFFYSITSMKLDSVMEYLIAQHFVENFMKVQDITRQSMFIEKMFKVSL